RLVDTLRGLLREELVALDEEDRWLLALLELDRRVGQRGRCQPPDEAALEGALLIGRLGADDPASLFRPAVLFAGDDVLGDVDETTGQVAGVGCPERRVREALAGAVGRDEVLED